MYCNCPCSSVIFAHSKTVSGHGLYIHEVGICCSEMRSQLSDIKVGITDMNVNGSLAYMFSGVSGFFI